MSKITPTSLLLKKPRVPRPEARARAQSKPTSEQAAPRSKSPTTTTATKLRAIVLQSATTAPIELNKSALSGGGASTIVEQRLTSGEPLLRLLVGRRFVARSSHVMRGGQRARAAAVAAAAAASAALACLRPIVSSPGELCTRRRQSRRLSGRRRRDRRVDAVCLSAGSTRRRSLAPLALGVGEAPLLLARLAPDIAPLRVVAAAQTTRPNTDGPTADWLR